MFTLTFDLVPCYEIISETIIHTEVLNSGKCLDYKGTAVLHFDRRDLSIRSITLANGF